MASIAAASVAAAAIGAWYTQRKTPALSDFTEPPKTWGESVVRLHEVVRISWKEALSKLGIWRLDHLLAIRHLSSRDMSDEIAEDIARFGTKVTFSEEWRERLRFIDLAMRYNRLLRGARSVAQIEQKLASMGSTSVTGNAADAEPRASILLSQLRPAILQPAYILVKDAHAKQLFFVIRGTHSVRDTVTSLTAHSKPHHLVDADGAVVLGRAHAGFLSTARWLAKTIKRDLAHALERNPGFELTIVGHSLGAGTAVVLTQALRELEGGDAARNAFADTKCLAFACPSALSKELANACAPFVTTVVAGADIVPTVSFSKVSELQQQIVSAAWEQQVLKKWRDTTRAVAAACAAPRGNADAGAPERLSNESPYTESLLGRVPGALTCGFGGRRKASGTNANASRESPRMSQQNVRDEPSTRVERVDAAVDRLAHLPGAAARGGGGRPRRWLGAQMRSLRRNLGAPLAAPETARAAGSGNKLARVVSVGGALLAGCVAPRRRRAEMGDGETASSVSSERERGFGLGGALGGEATNAPPEPSATRRNAFGEFVGRASPTLAAAAAAEAARASKSPSAVSACEAARREDDARAGETDSLLLDDDLDLDEHAAFGDAASSRMFERLEGEAAQEVLKLQEELSVIQAADGADDGAFESLEETFQNFETRFRDDQLAERRAAASAEPREPREPRSPLPAPKTTPSDPVALLGPGAPEAIKEAARAIGDRTRLESPEDAVPRRESESDPPREAVDGETLAARVATGKGGSNWSARVKNHRASAETKALKALKEDPDAFAAKLYPAGRILHLVLARRNDARDEDAPRADGAGETSLNERPGTRGASSRSEDEGTKRGYELYADVSVEAYDRIRLSKTMLSDHFLPKYIEALEDVRARLEAEKRGTNASAEAV